MTELGSIKDYNDIYDQEVKKIAEVWQPLQRQFDTWNRTLTPKRFHELRKRAEDGLFKIGLVGTLVVDPETPGQPILDIRGRVPDAKEHEHGFDHERKKTEVVEANKRGEKFRGQKEKHNG